MAAETVIVGAGPAGLSVGAMLVQARLPYTILDRAASVGSSWRGRYDSLELHTIRWLSGLPGARIPRRYGPWVSRDNLVAYLDDYVRRFGLRVDLGVEVRRIDKTDAGWLVETSIGPRTAANVVVATGYSRLPWIPPWPGRDSFTGTMVHSAAYREPSSYAGRHVLVVGAGNSGAEIAVELSAVAARVDVSVRTPPNIVRRDLSGFPSQLFGIALKRVPEPIGNPLSGLLRRVTVPDLTPFGLPAPSGDGFSQFLRSRTIPILDHGFVEAVRNRKISVVAAVDRLAGANVVLSDEAVLSPDLIVAATGYRPALEPMVGHLRVLDESGTPVIRGARQLPHAPGLYFVGIEVELSGVLREIGVEARQVGRALARTSASRVSARR